MPSPQPMPSPAPSPSPDPVPSPVPVPKPEPTTSEQGGFVFTDGSTTIGQFTLPAPFPAPSPKPTDNPLDAPVFGPDGKLLNALQVPADQTEESDEVFDDLRPSPEALPVVSSQDEQGQSATIHNLVSEETVADTDASSGDSDSTQSDDQLQHSAEAVKEKAKAVMEQFLLFGSTADQQREARRRRRHHSRVFSTQGRLIRL